VPRLVAVYAGRNNVFFDVCTAILARYQMFRRTLKPAGLYYGNFVGGRKLRRVVFPHLKTAIVAAMILGKKGLVTVFGQA